MLIDAGNENKADKSAQLGCSSGKVHHATKQIMLGVISWVHTCFRCQKNLLHAPLAQYLEKKSESKVPADNLEEANGHLEKSEGCLRS